MPGSRPHYKLEAWRESINLVKTVYEVTANFPKQEVYGLTARLRRCAISIPSNLAEGAARTSRRKFAQFLSITKGSVSELETQLIIATELGFLAARHPVLDILERVSKLVNGLHRTIAK